MGIIVGIDIGGSTTKIVGIQNDNIITPLMVRANDPIASLFGAFGKFIDLNGLALKDIECIAVTGVGASGVTKPIYGIRTVRVEEFRANGFGGLYLSGLDDALIVSMGTGTAFVVADRTGLTKHIGGTGMGGGALLGLSNLLVNVRNVDVLIDLAKNGNLDNVDLTVGDISKGVISTLPPHTTAANFGKISDVAEKGDIALAIFNLVFQTIGIMAVFAAHGLGRSEAVLIGNLTTIPYCQTVMEGLNELHGFHFIVPEHAEYGTALGAALATTRPDAPYITVE